MTQPSQEISLKNSKGTH